MHGFLDNDMCIRSYSILLLALAVYTKDRYTMQKGNHHMCMQSVVC